MKGKKANNKAQVKYRNPFHDHPLMKKGGVHEKAEKSKRHAMKVQLKKGEWYEQSVLTSVLFIPFMKLIFISAFRPRNG